MTEIKIIGEDDRRPAMVCAACQTRTVVDISGFMQDMTRIAKVRCSGCNRWIYMGLMIVGNLDQGALFGQIEMMVDAVNARGSLRVGEQGSVSGSSDSKLIS